MSNIENSQVFMYKNKNVHIKFNAHNAFLEQPSSGTPKDKTFKRHILKKSLGARKPKGLKCTFMIRDCKSQCRKKQNPIHERSLSWLGTNTEKNGLQVVKLVLWVKTPS